MKTQIIALVFFNFFSSCVLSLKDHSQTNAIRDKSENTSELIRKQIKDVDYRKSPEQVTLKKRVIVLPFLDREPSKRLESSRINARMAFVNSLNEREKYIVLEPNQVTIDYTKFKFDDLYDLQSIGKEILKTDPNSSIGMLIEGQVIDVRLKQNSEQIGIVRSMQTNYEVVVRLRMVSVQTGQELFHIVKTVTLDQDNTRVLERIKEDELFAKNPELVEVLIKDAFLDYTTQIEETMGEIRFEGRIAAIKGEKVYLNVGQISGLKIGDIMKVVENPSEIYDAQMGYQLGKIAGKIKGTLEIISYFGQDGAVGVLHSGAGFKESDRVEFY